MSTAAVLAPLFVQVALTFVLLFRQGQLRIGAVRGGALHICDIALGEPNWPKPVTQVGNAYHNQFQLPVLFYVLIALALITGRATLVLTCLSWLFVALRLWHALIHITHNNVPRRFFVFTAGLGVLCVMWLWFAASVLFGVIL